MMPEPGDLVTWTLRGVVQEVMPNGDLRVTEIGADGKRGSMDWLRDPGGLTVVLKKAARALLPWEKP